MSQKAKLFAAMKANPRGDWSIVAYAPDLQGCVSDGETPDEALHNIYDAIKCWLDAAVERGDTIPDATANRKFA